MACINKSAAIVPWLMLSVFASLSAISALVSEMESTSYSLNQQVTKQSTVAQENVHTLTLLKAGTNGHNSNKEINRTLLIDNH